LRGRAAGLDAVLDDVDVRVLDDSPPTPTDRAAIFHSAAAAFTARAHPDTAVGTLTITAPPEVLTGAAFANPLLVTVAAYLAVHDPGGTVPASRAELLTELTGHEDQHWQATAHTKKLDVGDEELRRRVVAVATLAGADTETEAEHLLALLPDLSDSSSTERCHALARWAHPAASWALRLIPAIPQIASSLQFQSLDRVAGVVRASPVDVGDVTRAGEDEEPARSISAPTTVPFDPRGRTRRHGPHTGREWTGLGRASWTRAQRGWRTRRGPGGHLSTPTARAALQT
jgi:hypothetical protein